MIENDKQYRVTQSQVKKFEEALVELEQNLDNSQEIHPLLLKAQKEALESQLNELREELLEYEGLKSGQQENIKLHSLDELPSTRIKSRIPSGISQKELKVDKDDSTTGAFEKIGNLKEEINTGFIITGSLKKITDKRILKAIEQHLQKIADDVELTIVDIDEESLKVEPTSKKSTSLKLTLENPTSAKWDSTSSKPTSAKPIL